MLYVADLAFAALVIFIVAVVLTTGCWCLYYRAMFFAATAREPGSSPSNGEDHETCCVWLIRNIDRGPRCVFGSPCVDWLMEDDRPPQPRTNAPADAPALAPIREPAEVDLEVGEVAGFIERSAPSSGQEVMPWASLPAHPPAVDAAGGFLHVSYECERAAEGRRVNPKP